MTENLETMPKARHAKIEAAAVEADPRWARLRARDASADGAFLYAVETTGVYCRPSCSARAPRPEHVCFFATAEAAERAGFRACRRCTPNEPPLSARRAALVSELCRFIEGRDSPPSLGELAARAGLSAFYVQRLFKSVTGVTPRAYAAARRAEKLRAGLRPARRVTDALYESGFGSASAFYEQSRELLGMTPARYRAGGADLVIEYALAESSLGCLLVAATERGLCALSLGDGPAPLVRELERRFPLARRIRADARLGRLVTQVVGLVEEPQAARELPLDVRGTAFERRVWSALRAVPLGKTVSYSELAEALGAPRSARAVARACANNALAVVIPCHRAVRADGELAGYRWGTERKRALLEREARSCGSVQPGNARVSRPARRRTATAD
jgi:AraC family transcriptional regulator of adaptative response/methylated-DNA-[protein]-cysteine methyltransferase